MPAGRSRYTDSADRRPASGASSSDCLVIQITGELDVSGLTTFRNALSVAVDAAPRAVVVDIRDAGFISLRNALVLAEAVRRATSHGIGIHVPTGCRQVERALDVTGVRMLVPRDSVVSDN
ncbi:STAS domain-containing protein [Nocardia terrae]|nr:STAS domain-containing protein [Nocardia terrae]